MPEILKFIDDLVNLIALALSAGDAFLPGAAEYDDLFYKLVEAGDVLVKFRDSCMFHPRFDLRVCVTWEEYRADQGC